MGFKDEFERFDATLWARSTYSTPDVQYKGENAVIEEGFLKCLVTAGQNDGGQLETLRTYTFGRYRSRFKAAPGKAITTAFYLYRHDAGLPDEIDIEIFAETPDKMLCVMWKEGTHDQVSVDLGFDSTKDFHEYGFDWYEDHIDFFVDGKLVLRYVDTEFIPVRRMHALLTAHSPAWRGTPDFDSQAVFDLVIVEAEPRVPPVEINLPLIAVAVLAIVNIALVLAYAATKLSER